MLHRAQAKRCCLARSLLLSGSMKHLSTSVRKKLRVLLFASLFLSVLAPQSLSFALTGYSSENLNTRGQRLNGDATPQLPADGAETRRPKDKVGDTTLSHKEQQRHFRAGDSYVPSDQELHLLYPPGSRRPLWGY